MDCTGRELGEKRDAFVVFVCIAASVRELIWFWFWFWLFLQRRLGSFGKCEFFKKIFLPEMFNMNDEDSEEDIGNSHSPGIAIAQ